jgi:hypothetical protein
MDSSKLQLSAPCTSLIICLALSLPNWALAQASGRNVDCHVESGGKVAFNGTCRFSSEAGGSFTLENTDRNQPLFGDILSVSVSIVSPGAAEVRGLTRQGVNSRWGAAQRSARDSACWEGSDFNVCAR